MLKIVKASAGSGKTFLLVLEYLRLILTTPAGYRQILAITFTNKATAEMKERILNQLWVISRGDSSKYLQLLTEQSGKPEEFLRQKAKSVLEHILFDFNRFYVSTIDKFTQRILKAFYREMKISPGLLVETDTDLLLKEAVDRLISNAVDKPGLFRWLKDFVEEKMESNKSFSIEKDLFALGNELFRETLQSAIDDLGQFFHQGNNSRSYRDMLYGIIKSYEKQLKEQAGELVRLFSSEGYVTDDFANKRNGLGAFMEKIAKGEQPENMQRRIGNWLNTPDKWMLATNKRYNEFSSFARGAMLPLLNRLFDFMYRESKAYHTARAILSEWFTAALMVDLNDEIRTLGKEKGILPLADSNILLKKVIDGSDTPFVYEKAGNIWRHFMLDEFQDTSELQWENLRPLIINSLSDGHFNLVVGDVKQSIYRWRNSNWNILKSEIRKDFVNFPLDAFTLASNFRSGKQVVTFNNAFFTLFKQKMAGHEKLAEAPEFRENLLEMYDDILQQHIPGKGPDGFVSVETIDKEDSDFKEMSAIRLTSQIKEMFDQGYKASDMAILVRKNDEGSFLVNHFLTVAGLPENLLYNLRIVSGESLLLKSSTAVSFVIALLRHLSDPNNRLYKATLLHLYPSGTGVTETGHSENPAKIDNSPPDHHFEAEFEKLLRPKMLEMETLSMVSGVDELIVHAGKTFNLYDLPGELPFLQSLIDRAAELKKSGVNDISGFLRWWEEKGVKAAVQFNDQVDAIRLLSIHKAKGLEFRVVFIPFADWVLVDSGNSMDRKKVLWCKPDLPPFDAAPLVPVRFTADLQDTIFVKEYFTELSNLITDNLNLVYVAFTRAKAVLRINIPLEQKANRLGTLLGDTIRELGNQPGFEEAWDEERKRFSFGTLPLVRERASAIGKAPSPEWVFNDFSERLRLRPGSDEFFDQTEKGDFRKNRGNVLHAILAGIFHTGDVDPACLRALASGMLLPDEFDDTVRKLKEMVNHPVARGWFSDKWKILTENDLLTPEETFRPDRMMLGDGCAVVVDFKTGERRDSHASQVKRYAQLLRETGIPDVRSFLWYIRENEVLEVWGHGPGESGSR
jgi:ATP-dependent exoDNAse (exonuclease V) beta subunit